jgi:ATP-dependent protease ClpP protease subunit
MRDLTEVLEIPHPPARLPWDGAASAVPTSVYAPQISLLGRVDEAMLDSFLKQCREVPVGDTPIAVELMTFGGDADIGRRIGVEIRLARTRLQRRFIFIGKTVVYSAGVTIMSAFPRADRFLTHEAVLLIHCRQLEMSVALSGTLRANAQHLREVLEQIEIGLRVEQEGFAHLIEGSDVSFDELFQRAATNWYLPAPDALERRLIAGLV